MPRVAFATLGCKVNQSETEVLAGLFQERGYTLVAFAAFADIYVINTCSVTHLGEKKSRQLIRRATKRNVDAVVAVAGCYAQLSPAQVAALDGVAVVVGTQDRGRIVDLVEEAVRTRSQINTVSDIRQAEAFEDLPLRETAGRTRAFLKIQDGCANYCTYCIIPYARGTPRSRPLASVVRAAAHLILQGFKEIVLTGIHLGAYGRDLPGDISLTDAVKAVLALDGLVRLRLGSLESGEVTGALIELIQTDSRLCRHLHLPLQAGDDGILLAMQRGYSTMDYRRLLEYIRAEVPDIALSTDIIVGFPGETQDSFERSLRFVDRQDFAQMHIFPYSRRQGTPAADFPDQVAELVKRQRLQAMEGLSAAKTEHFHRQYLGQELPVLLETEADGIVNGLSGHYIRVYAPFHDASLGSVRVIRIEKLYRDGLWGAIVG